MCVFGTVVVVVVVVHFGSLVSPPSLNCLLASCPSTLILVSALDGFIPAKNQIYGCSLHQQPASARRSISGSQGGAGDGDRKPWIVAPIPVFAAVVIVVSIYI